MAKKKFHFNPESLSYEEIELSLKHKLKRFLTYLFSGASMGGVFFFVFVTFIDSPEERQLEQEKSKLQTQYKLLTRQMDEMQEVLEDLQERDDNLYRVIFQADPIPLALRKSIPPNTAYYEQLLEMTNAQIAVSTTQKSSELKKQIYLQSKSYDHLMQLAKNNEARLRHLPAIQPVLNKDLKRTASGFGWRIDPVYRTRRFHEGMDFTAPTGTEIFATGDGTIAYTGWKQGYGNCVDVDHGFGYLTRYGHCSKLIAKRGQKVQRGDVIALVGSTGKSTGPHLHYEVHFRGKVMNPQNFYYLDLSPSEYDKMIQLSNNTGQMFD